MVEQLCVVFCSSILNCVSKTKFDLDHLSTEKRFQFGQISERIIYEHARIMLQNACEKGLYSTLVLDSTLRNATQHLIG